MKKKNKISCFLLSLTLVCSAIGFSVLPKTKEVKAAEPKTENTEVFSISVEHGGNGWIWLAFCLSNYDYKNGGGQEIWDGSFNLDQSGANVKTKVTDQNGDLLTYNSARENRYRSGRIKDGGTPYNFFLYLDGTIENPGFTKINVPQGTTFPSYKLAYKLDAETRTDFYKTTYDISFTYDSTSKKFIRDSKTSEKVEVDVTSFKLIQEEKSKEYYYMSFGLSNYDWVKPSAEEKSGTLQNATWYLDTVTNLVTKVYVGDNLVSLDAARGNRFRCAYSSYQLIVKGDFSKHGVSKVTIKEGAMFPSKATGMGANTKDLDGNNAGWVATEIKFYVVKADTTFVIDDDPNVDPNTFVLESEYAASLATLKTNSLAFLETYRGGASNFTINKTAYDAAINTAKSGINDATNKVDVNTAFASGKAAIDLIEDDQTLLNDLKITKKNDLQDQYDALKVDRILNATVLMEKFAEGKVNITNATTVKEVNDAYDNALTNMQNIPNDATTRTQEKANISSYKGGANNYKINASSYNKAVQDAHTAIDNATDETSLALAVSNGQAAIDIIENDDKIRQNYNKTIDEKYNAIDLSKYDEENQTKIKDLCAKAKSDVSKATSYETLNSIISQLDADIAAVPVKSNATLIIIISVVSVVVIGLIVTGIILIKKRKSNKNVTK